MMTASEQKLTKGTKAFTGFVYALAVQRLSN